MVRKEKNETRRHAQKLNLSFLYPNPFFNYKTLPLTNERDNIALIGTAGYNITRECMLPKQDIKPPVPCRPCRLYKLQLDYCKLIYIKEEKHPYTYTRLQITGIYFEKQQFVFFLNNTFILFHQGIHSYITSMIHCTDSYKLMSITF